MPGFAGPGITAWGPLAVRLARFAVGDIDGDAEAGGAGRGFADPIYRIVTENRNELARKQGWFHSSCGDLPHWLLMALGVRLPWVNRAELKGFAVEGYPAHPGYRIGQNISLLIGGAGEKVGPGAVFEPGDVLEVGHDSHDEHVDVVLRHDTESGLVLSADYGLPAGGLVESGTRVEGGRLIRGRRPVNHVIRLGRVLELARAAGLLVAPSVPAGFSW